MELTSYKKNMRIRAILWFEIQQEHILLTKNNWKFAATYSSA
jgi:hypothetical protein